MLRRCLLFMFLPIFLVHFFSASYNTFSLENFAENIFDFFDASTIILGSLFILFFIYEKGAALVFGAILFLIGVWLWNKGNKGNTGVRVNNLVKPMDKIKNVSGSSSPSKPSGWIHGGKVLNLDMVERKKAWQKKLNALYEDNARLAKRNNGRIPARGTSDGERRAKNMKSIKVLENLIRSQ